MKTLERIEVMVEAAKPGQVWVYPKPDSLWTILKVCQKASGRKFTAKGVVPFEPRHGDLLELQGTWKTSDFNGSREFSFTAALLKLPEDGRALLEYAATITSGIGPAREAEIWMLYGERWREHPGLEGLSGISDQTRWNWSETLKRLEKEQAKAGAMAFLISKGCTLNMALKVWDEWAEDTVRRVQDDPYTLAELPRVGFLMIDGHIRRNLGIGDADPRRARAAALYSARELAERAGTLIPVSELVKDLDRLVACSGAETRRAIEALLEAGALREVAADMVALEEDFKNESAIAEYMEGAL